MENDNVYQGTYFQTPQSSKDDEKREIDETLEQLPLLKEVVEYLEQRSQTLSSVDAIQVDVTKDADSHRIQVLTNKAVKYELDNIASWIKSRAEATHQ